MTNQTHAYLALDLQACSHQNLDEHERIEVQKVRVQDLQNQCHPEFFVNGIMIITFHAVLNYLKKEHQ
jgi:hypothetical protein